MSSDPTTIRDHLQCLTIHPVFCVQNSTLRRANRRRRTCCTGQRSRPPPSAASWQQPLPIKLARLSPVFVPVCTCEWSGHFVKPALFSACASVCIPQLNATPSVSSVASNSTMRSVFCGTVCRSPVSRPINFASKVSGIFSPICGPTSNCGLSSILI